MLNLARLVPALRFAVVFGLPVIQAGAQPAAPLELSRPVRAQEFLCAVGTEAGVFGDESGRVEAWVYPLKLIRNFRLEFDVDGHTLPAATLARTIIARPEATTVVYTGDTFSVRETFFVPVHHAGAVIVLEIESAQSMTVRARFERDFQLEWPAALGATYANWDANLHALSFGEESRKYAALVGSPTGENQQLEYQSNYSASAESSFDLSPTRQRKETRIIVLAASTHGATEAESTYQSLAANYKTLVAESAAYYQAYLQKTVQVELPDPQLQQAYDWSRVSIVQGVVNNPALGTGLIAGYRTSGVSARPGFAWFFGRDSLWTAFALNSEGDFATTRTALEFLSRFQRDDGKIPHEIAQTANLVDWFKNYPYGFASADSTPLYIVGVNDYVSSSGDVAFARQKWDSLWKAYQFMHSTYDANGLPKNLGVGHGWVEGGPLLPVETELYQSSLAAEALRSLSTLAKLAGKSDISTQLEAEFSRLQQALTQFFWLNGTQRYAFALDPAGKPVDQPSVLATVPMWFGLLPEDKAAPMISELARSGHQADWGMRIISTNSSLYSGGGYHFGSVWPLFTGWASVGEYRYHRPLPAYLNLRANALLALDGSPGHVTEVLSGDYYQPLSTASPHQIWSAAMVVSPLLRGLFGLRADAATHTLLFAPHVPGDWIGFAIKHMRIADCALDLRYKKASDAITLELTRTGAGDCNLEFSPAVSPLAQVTGAQLNGHPAQFRLEPSATDQHVTVKLSVPTGQSTLRIAVRNDFSMAISSQLPALGTASRGLRIFNESWSASHDRLDVDVEGVAGSAYDLRLFNAEKLARVEGAVKSDGGPAKLTISMPPGSPGTYVQQKVTLFFSAASPTAR